MNILISNSSGKPIYEQIYEQIKSKIIVGELHENDALPSMRLLAKELRISLITTKRAYEELEKDGFIVSVTGKGSFVASANLELLKEENLRKIEELMTEIIKLSEISGLSITEIQKMFELLYKGEWLCKMR